MKAKFVGDHSRYHCGSEAVANYIKRQIRNVAELTEDNDYDVLVINGEGSMHHRAPTYFKKMEEARYAASTGRPFHLVNTIWQSNGAAEAGLLGQARLIVVREILSQQALASEAGVFSEIKLDFSFFEPLDMDAEFKDFEGKEIATDFYSTEFQDFVRPTTAFLSKFPFISMKKMGWSNFVRSLSTASLLITGRHHAVYAACRARTPFVALRGNSHKIEGIVATAGIEIPICEHPRELMSTIEWARSNKEAYSDLFDWMASQKPWTFEP